MSCLAAVMLAGVAGARMTGGAQQAARPGTVAPEFRDVSGWVNSKPLTMAELRGQVVVVHFWTFG
jgi:hypothetical protein